MLSSLTLVLVEKQSKMTVTIPDFTVGVLALQGAFSEHVQLLRQAAAALKQKKDVDAKWEFIEVRTPQELAQCEGLIIPGGESTTMSLVAARSGILEPLREFVKYVLQGLSRVRRTDKAIECRESQPGAPARA